MASNNDHNLYLPQLSNELLESYRKYKGIEEGVEIVIKDTGYDKYAARICRTVKEIIKTKGNISFDISKVSVSGSTLELIIKKNYKVPNDTIPGTKQLQTLDIMAIFLGKNNWFDFIKEYSLNKIIEMELTEGYVQSISKEFAKYKDGKIIAWNKFRVDNGKYLYEDKYEGNLSSLFRLLKLQDAKGLTVQTPNNQSSIKVFRFESFRGINEDVNIFDISLHYTLDFYATFNTKLFIKREQYLIIDRVYASRDFLKKTRIWKFKANKYNPLELMYVPDPMFQPLRSKKKYPFS